MRDPQRGGKSKTRSLIQRLSEVDTAKGKDRVGSDVPGADMPASSKVTEGEAEASGR